MVMMKVERPLFRELEALAEALGTTPAAAAAAALSVFFASALKGAPVVAESVMREGGTPADALAALAARWPEAFPK